MHYFHVTIIWDCALFVKPTVCRVCILEISVPYFFLSTGERCPAIEQEDGGIVSSNFTLRAQGVPSRRKTSVVEFPTWNSCTPDLLAFYDRNYAEVALLGNQEIKSSFPIPVVRPLSRILFVSIFYSLPIADRFYLCLVAPIINCISSIYCRSSSLILGGAAHLALAILNAFYKPNI